MSGGGFGWGGAARGIHLPGQVGTGRLRGEPQGREAVPQQLDIAALVQAEIRKALAGAQPQAQPVTAPPPPHADYAYAQQQGLAMLEFVSATRESIAAVLDGLVDLENTLSRFAAGAEITRAAPGPQEEDDAEATEV